MAAGNIPQKRLNVSHVLSLACGQCISALSPLESTQFSFVPRAVWLVFGGKSIDTRVLAQDKTLGVQKSAHLEDLGLFGHIISGTALIHTFIQRRSSPATPRGSIPELA
jgi:hypothetical protein